MSANPSTSINRSLFRDTAVLGWAVAFGVSQLGDVVFFASLAYAAAKLGSPALAGTVLACAAIPRAVLMLLGGAVTDRFDARRLMLTSDIACAVVLVGALIAIHEWGTSAPILIAIGALFGTADAFYGPASATFPRQLVAADDLPRLAGFRQLIGRFTTIGGGPLGLALVAWRGFSASLAADAISYAVIALTLLVVKPRWSRSRSTGRGIIHDIGGGLRYLVRTPKVRDLVIALSGLNVFGGPVLSVGIALRTTQQGWSPYHLGILTGCIGAGAVVGTLTAMVVRPARPLRFALALMFVQAAAVAAVGLLSFPGEVAAMLVVGVTAGLASPLMSGTVQAVVDEEYLGRTNSVLSLADSGLMPISLAGFGALAGTAGLPIAC
ncbi:MAG TPA: MFS transporter, partial [Micromonosporaceae bacterium]